MLGEVDHALPKAAFIASNLNHTLEFESGILMSCYGAKEILLTILQRIAFVDCEFGRMKLCVLKVEGRGHLIRKFYFVAGTCAA